MYEPVLIRHILTCVVWRFGTVRRAAQCMATCHFEDMPIVLVPWCVGSEEGGGVAGARQPWAPVPA